MPAGCVLGTVALCVARPLASPFNASLAPRLMATPGGWFSAWCMESVFAVAGALSFLFFLTLFLQLIRVQWLAALLFIGTMSLLVPLPGANISSIVLISFAWYALTRFGLLSTSALLYVNYVADLFPSPFSRSAWYVESAVVAVSSVVMLAVYAFRTTVAGRPLWRDNL